MEYFRGLIEAYAEGHVSDHVHLGLFVPGSGRCALAEAQEKMSLYHLRWLSIFDGQSVADVGCGFGGTLRMIDREYSDISLIGINIDPAQIEVAKIGPWRNNVDFFECDAADFSSQKASWLDGVISIEAFFHFSRQVEFIKIAAKALRKNGRLVLSTIFLSDDPSAVRSCEVVRQGFNPWPRYQLSEMEILSAANSAGLQLLHREDLSLWCMPSFDWLCDSCPPDITSSAVIELRRLFEQGSASYPFFVFSKL